MDTILMEEIVRNIAATAGLAIEAIAVAVVSFGALEALGGLLRMLTRHGVTAEDRKAVWRRFASWLVFGLEFELAADIVGTVVAPTWEQLGQLGAIAVIRTFLNYFLERELAEVAEIK